jgi:hypothetical protein
MDEWCGWGGEIGMHAMQASKVSKLTGERNQIDRKTAPFLNTLHGRAGPFSLLNLGISFHIVRQK